MAIMDLVSRVQLTSFVIMLTNYIQYSSFSSCPFLHISGDNKSKFILDRIITMASLIVCTYVYLQYYNIFVIFLVM